jgi:hypothetical protein
MKTQAHARRISIAVGLAALAVPFTLVSSAHADTVTIRRSATVEWIQEGPIPGVAGNVHVGRVQAWVPAGERVVESLYGEMFDYTCPAGYLPDGLWLEALPQLDAACTIEDNLIIETGDLDLNVDGKLHRARLVGSLGYIHGLAVGDPGSFAVDLRWDAPGDKTVVRDVIFTRPRTILVTTTRDASVTGTIGSEEIGTGDQISSGVVERYKEIQRD